MRSRYAAAECRFIIAAATTTCARLLAERVRALRPDLHAHMLTKLLKSFQRRTPAPPQVSVPAPAEDEALVMQGNAALGRGDLAEAQRCYAAACEVQPAQARPRLNLGYVLLERDRPQEAIEALQHAIELHRPEQGMLHEALYLRGRAQQALGRPEEALASYRAALDAQPAFEEALVEAAPMLLARQRAEEVLALATAARAISPSPLFLMLQARALHALGRPAEAVASLDVVLAQDPDHVGALDSRGNLLLELGRAEDAVADFRRVLLIQPDDPATLANVAAALNELERPQEAIRLTAAAAVHHPQHAELQLNRAIAQLTTGDWLAGWQGLEWRWHAWTGKAAPWARWPRWTGEDLAGCSILLICEQGLGDSIQCLRYVPQVAARARQVVLVLQPELVPLAGALPANCQVVPLGSAVPPADYQCALMSLHGVFGATPASVPAPVPYLQADPQRVQHWRSLLPEGVGPRVGLAWSGGVKPPHRSVPLAMLSPLADLQCLFVGLQPQVREADHAAFHAWPRLVDARASLQDFGDTAALVSCLDLVITVDTSVAHLAGALARPVWNLLRFAPDWRWMLERSDTPWYPTMRLYRQRTLRDWSGVTADVRRDLEAFVSART